MDSEQLMRTCVEVCEDRKGLNIQVFDVRGHSTLTDYYLFCSATSMPHLRALQQNLDRKLKDANLLPRSVEGTPESKWILVDYNDVLIHLFEQETRELYNVEALLDEDLCIYPEVAEEAS